MQITIELSLYPLKAEYEDTIINFINLLRQDTSISLYTHSMSSYIKGESKAVFEAISHALEVLDKDSDTVSLVMKLVNRDLPVENGFLNFE